MFIPPTSAGTIGTQVNSRRREPRVVHASNRPDAICAAKARAKFAATHQALERAPSDSPCASDSPTSHTARGPTSGTMYTAKDPITGIHSRVLMRLIPGDGPLPLRAVEQPHLPAVETLIG